MQREQGRDWAGGNKELQPRSCQKPEPSMATRQDHSNSTHTGSWIPLPGPSQPPARPGPPSPFLLGLPQPLLLLPPSPHQGIPCPSVPCPESTVSSDMSPLPPALGARPLHGHRAGAALTLHGGWAASGAQHSFMFTSPAFHEPPAGYDTSLSLLSRSVKQSHTSTSQCCAVRMKWEKYTFITTTTTQTS